MVGLTPPGVAHHHVPIDPDRARFRIDIDHHRVHPVGKWRAVVLVVVTRLEARLEPHRALRFTGQVRLSQLGQRHRAARRAAHVGRAVAPLHILGRHFDRCAANSTHFVRARPPPRCQP
jgi:hypothetical protein